LRQKRGKGESSVKQKGRKGQKRNERRGWGIGGGKGPKQKALAEPGTNTTRRKSGGGKGILKKAYRPRNCGKSEIKHKGSTQGVKRVYHLKEGGGKIRGVGVGMGRSREGQKLTRKWVKKNPSTGNQMQRLSK